MTPINLAVGWIAVLAGLLAGTVIGLFFDRPDWLDGYGSWRRRMLRLGHVALVATGLLNVAFALSLAHVSPGGKLPVASTLFAAATVAMPGVCFLSAWRPALRHLFFVPVVCLVVASADFIFRGLFG